MKFPKEVLITEECSDSESFFVVHHKVADISEDRSGDSVGLYRLVAVK